MNAINWKIQSNVEAHGLEFAAKAHKAECKREEKPAQFDTFYFAIFGKWPARKTTRNSAKSK